MSEQSTPPSTPPTPTTSKQRSDTFFKYTDWAASALVITAAALAIRNMRTRITTQRQHQTAQSSRDIQRQQHLHRQWLRQQRIQYAAEQHAREYIETIERARRAEYVEETYKHAEHNWSYSKRYKPPHYSTWGDTTDTAAGGGFQPYPYGGDNAYNNSVQPLTAEDINARAVLGLKTDLSNADLIEKTVKHAYRKQAKAAHPDVDGGDAVRFAQVTDAYNKLMEVIQHRNEYKRKHHQEYG